MFDVTFEFLKANLWTIIGIAVVIEMVQQVLKRKGWYFPAYAWPFVVFSLGVAASVLFIAHEDGVPWQDKAAVGFHLAAASVIFFLIIGKPAVWAGERFGWLKKADQ